MLPEQLSSCSGFRINARFDSKGLSLWPFLFSLTYLVQKKGLTRPRRHGPASPEWGPVPPSRGRARRRVRAACAPCCAALLGPTSCLFRLSLLLPSFATRGAVSAMEDDRAALACDGRWHVRDAAGAWCPVEHHLCFLVSSGIAHSQERPGSGAQGPSRLGAASRGRASFHFLFWSLSVQLTVVGKRFPKDRAPNLSGTIDL